MNSYGFIRTAAAVPAVRIADPGHNAEEICRLAEKAFTEKVSLIVFPELCITGCTCGDLFNQSILISGAEKGVRKVLEFSRGKVMTIVVSAPVQYGSKLYNCAVVITNGSIKGIVPKIYLSASDKRTFSSGEDFLKGNECLQIKYAGQSCHISPNLQFKIGGAVFAIETGDDLWAPVPPSSYHAVSGAHIIANPSSGYEILMTDRYRRELLSQHSAKTVTGYIHASAGFGESSQDYVYAGASSVWENGEAVMEGKRFETESSLLIADIDIEKIENLRKRRGDFFNVSPDGAKSEYGSFSRLSLGNAEQTDFEAKFYRNVEPHPFAPEKEMDYRCSEILSIQIQGLVRRLSHINCATAVVGISGGLDSTLALLVTVLAFDKLGWSRDRIIGVTMPGYGTTVRTKSNAVKLMEQLGVTSREISIAAACDQHFKDIGHDKNVTDVTFENSQARERTQILMDVANQTNGLVIGTGDLSELALGWATYNGDHMSMYGVNAGVPKTLVRGLVTWAAENMFDDVRTILLDIVDTPISPELLPANEDGEIKQVTEDLVGPYELHDFFIYNFIRFGYTPAKIMFLARKAFEERYDNDTIRKWLKTFMRRFFNQQFKRSCLPDGPKVGSVGLSPRGDWSMPSDAWSTLFINSI
ncbi:MAG: NAD(+) synthase [Bacteroidales bacterium]|nr:NAD(+) synthase [Bacteroidales bacterium]